MENEKRFIDADSDFILKDTNGYTLDFGYGYIQIYDNDGNLRCQFDIDDIPTIEAVEVVHAKWEKDPEMRRMSGHIYDYRCSHCHALAEKSCYNNHDKFTNYCPNCGAKMDLEE